VSDDVTKSSGEARSVDRHLGAGAAFSVIADVGTLCAATGLSVVLARTVGPSGNGTFALLATTINIAVLVVSLGITAGITYQVSHGQWPVRSALVSCLWMSFGLGLLGTAAALGFYALTRHSVLHDVSPHLAIIAIAAIAPALLFQFITAILLGRDRYEGYASLLLLNAGILLFGAVGLALAFGLTGALAGFTASMTITALVGVRVASRPTRGAVGRSDSGQTRATSWYLRRALRFGLQSWPANLLQQANYHLDLLILGGYVAAVHVGLYSVAVTVVQIAWILPHGIQTVLFPRAASLDAAERAGDLTAADTDAVMARAIRHTVVLLVPSAVIVTALLLFVPVVYGHKFDETVLLGLILLPGVLVLGVGKVLSSVIAGRGRPRYNLYNGLMTCVVTVGLYFWLIPRYGEWGAAIASSISYAVTTLVATGFLITVIEVPLSTVFIPTRADMHNYVEALAALRRNYLQRGLGPPARGRT
jgi:O-antigen/teichoic acid export membrane protein